MIRHRADEHVVASGSAMDRALVDGLTGGEVVALVAARHAWWVLGRLDPATVTDDLRSALQSPVVDGWDVIFVRRARAELSLPVPTVRP